MSDVKPPDINQHGPHGGIWVRTNTGFVEVSVFETGVPPRFRLYFFDFDGKDQPLQTVTLETIRPGGEQQRFGFEPRGSYLEATSELPEPHEFEAILNIEAAGHTPYTLKFTEEGHSHGEQAHSHGGQSHGHNHDKQDHNHSHGKHEHGHSHGGHRHGGHNHTHATGPFAWLINTFAHSHSITDKTDTALESNERGIQTLKITLVILGLTAVFQVIIVAISGSVALLADTIHNFGDAATSFPLWIAFALARRGANRRYTYGYGKVEDVAGVVIVLLIFFSACVAGYESIMKIIHPLPIVNLGWVSLAAIIGFIGNEWVALYRIRVGKQIGSAALVADGYHARVDGFTSLAVLLGVIGVWIGLPIIDPLVGIGITIAILFIVRDAARSVWVRLVDGIEPEILQQIEHAPMHVPGVRAVREVRARWLGHRIHTDLVVEVAPELNVGEADRVARSVEASLRDHVRLLDNAVVRTRPSPS